VVSKKAISDALSWANLPTGVIVSPGITVQASSASGAPPMYDAGAIGQDPFNEPITTDFQRHDWSGASQVPPGAWR
jgi:hypothetical protein